MNSALKDSLLSRLNRIYPEKANEIFIRLELLLTKYKKQNGQTNNIRHPYTHKDVYLISYGDSIKKPGEMPLHTLHNFVNEELSDCVSAVHILPFFPYSSDDGFSVIDYRKVREDLGDWSHVKKLSKDYKVMADLVINHISSKSKWFQDFLEDKKPASEYFHTLDNNTDVSLVTRPRSTPLLTPYQTKSGTKYLWTTFSPDQVDVNFSNPDVLLEYIDILLFYLSKGISIIRLDAVAFLWKKAGTPSIHLEETHEVIKLLRDVALQVNPAAVIITETNVPHKENISYFGDGDEAHMVYNFSLPPLLLHAILTENASYLTEWSATLNTPPDGCTYFNFAASHDGIGVRPLEGLVPQDEFQKVVDSVMERGGKVSYKQNPNGIETPYELNITFFDAFRNPNHNRFNGQIKRFMCSQAMMLGFRGVPAIYIHSFMATFNYHRGVREKGLNRAINRMSWDYDEAKALIHKEGAVTNRVMKAWKKLLNIRRNEPAFDPQGGKKVLNSPKEVFAMWRCSPDGKDRLVIAGNVSSKTVKYQVPFRWNKAVELISGQELSANDTLTMKPWQVMWVKY